MLFIRFFVDKMNVVVRGDGFLKLMLFISLNVNVIKVVIIFFVYKNNFVF